MPDPNANRDVADWRQESRLYRVRPALGWWVALLVVPLLLALIGWAGLADRTVRGEAVPGAEAPSSVVVLQPSDPGPRSPVTAPPVDPNLPFGPFSIKRTADGFALGGSMPDQEQKAALLKAIELGLPGATVIERLGVDPAVRVPDIALLGGVFSVTAMVPDFSLVVDRGVLTLTGRAPSEQEKATVQSAAADAWPGLPIVNDLRVE